MDDEIAATARELEFTSNPVDRRVVTLEPIETENHRIRNRDNSKSNIFCVITNGELGDDVVGDESVRNGTVINCAYCDRLVLGTAWETVPVREGQGYTRTGSTTVNESECMQRLAVRK